MPKDIAWKAYEHSHTEKNSDWFWALGIVAISSAVVAILFQNFLFAILIVVGSFTIALLSQKPPRELTFTLTPRGIMIDDALFPYQMMIAFWVEGRDSEDPTLIIDLQRFMVPHIIVSLTDVNTEQVHTYLSEHLPEKELKEPFGQRILEKLGV
ncbi:hypothetical protein COB18_02960 [Candidatus Kaiserbacteria bacterium]|nr:MAG: hypothetical protein COB18_02960 [Candidatus Kaiserbacteria bacterium]